MCGFSSAVVEVLSDEGIKTDVLRIGIPDRFIEHGKQEELYKILGLDEEGIYKQIKEFLKRSK
jgi:1-deoxy-D-xylulose-5-phosphate synthase